MGYKSLYVISQKTFYNTPGISTLIDQDDYPIKLTAVIFPHFKNEETGFWVVKGYSKSQSWYCMEPYHLSFLLHQVSQEKLGDDTVDFFQVPHKSIHSRDKWITYHDTARVCP